MTKWHDEMDFWRYRPAIAVWGFCCAVMGAVFAVPIWRGGSPITPDLYGRTVYEIPALVWASYQIFAGILAGIGCVARRPNTAAIGLSMLLLQFMAAGLLATLQTQGGVVSSGCIVFVVITGLSVQSAWGANGGGR